MMQNSITSEVNFNLILGGSYKIKAYRSVYLVNHCDRFALFHLLSERFYKLLLFMFKVHIVLWRRLILFTFFFYSINTFCNQAKIYLLLSFVLII